MTSRSADKTSTRTFGSSGRASHDATAFYERFETPTVSTDDTVAPCAPADGPIEERLRVGDATNLDWLPDRSVALVVTSPPYFAGKEYEVDGKGPESFAAYLDMIHGAFSEAHRVLEPGGRIAVNVANLGRRPFRNLAGVVSNMLEDIGFLLRGEIVWLKAESAGGSVAFGSYRLPSNPVMRDLTERVVVASKGRFDRAIPRAKRAKLGLPHEATISKEEFLAATVDVWRIRPESAKRVGHPAPFPVALPARLIQLHTYAGDVVCDPFLGSGSTAIAAAQAGRRYVGCDLDPAYVEQARTRVGALTS